jgi:recombination protein RecR
MSIPEDLKRTIEFFEKLPGIGPKTAKRLGFYLLRVPEADLQKAAEHLSQLKQNTHFCTTCFNLTDDEVCSICESPQRDHRTIAVVEDVLDLLSFETGNHYTGVYHVLHGRH